jgi:hypothetical protein
MPDPKHSSDKPQPNRRGSSPDNWTKKFAEGRDISFRLNPRYARMLAEISQKVGATPNDVVRDMVVLSLEVSLRRDREGARDGSN